MTSPRIPLGIISVLFASIAIVGAQDKKKKTKRVNPAMAKVEDVAGLPRVLLIGDSISIGYTVGVRKLLEGKANVHRPIANCGPTTSGLANIDKWLATGGADKKWDVIHFNWGLHDLKYMGPDKENLADPKAETSHRQVPPDQYEKNLEILTQKLKATGAKVIWRNTTPVPPGSKGRVVGDSVMYNEIAAKVMAKLDIPTHDLYSLAKANLKKAMKPANVHFTPQGNELLSADVTREILTVVGKK